MKGIGFGVFGLVVCLALLGTGYVFDKSTYQKPYQTISSGNVENYISGIQQDDYTSYMQLTDVSSLFIVHEPDFSPAFSYQALAQSTHVSILYNPDESSSVDVTDTGGLELKGTGYTVAAITVLNGNQRLQYSTQIYLNNPTGYQQDRSNIGIYFIAGGFLGLLITLYIVLLKNGIVIIPLPF
jgi:hypothetical protein